MSVMSTRRWHLLKALLAACLVYSGLAVGELRQDWQAAVDQASVEAWSERVLGQPIREGVIDGAVISIVKDGETLLNRGYGLADVVTGREATPETPFRSGSLNKVFTAIAVLQLVERGLVSLDDNINDHLKRTQVDSPEGVITIRDLLTHSAGFDDRFRNTLMPSPPSEFAPPEYMQRTAHDQVRAPGEVITYCNHCMGTAGTLIEDVTGLTYGDYMDQNLFQPLGMENTFVELPGKLPADIAVEHDFDDDGNPVPRPLLYKATFYLGSGGFFFSSTDLAGFLKAVLARSPDLLTDESWEKALNMQLVAGDVRTGGIGLGFWMYELKDSATANAEHTPIIIGHGGATQGFRSRLFMFPEERIGLFISTVNSDYGIGGSAPFDTFSVAWDFVATFRGYQAYPTYPQGSPDELEAFTGSYITNRRPYAGPEFHSSALTTTPTKVSLRGDDLYWGDTALRRVGPRSFERPRDGMRPSIATFSESGDTVWTSATSSMTRFPAWHPQTYLAPLLLGSVLVALSVLVPAAWPRSTNTRRLDLTLAAAAILALAATATQFVALALGDEYRVESSRFAIQVGFGWASLVALLVAVFSLRQQPELSRSGAVYRYAVVLALAGLAVLHIWLDVIRF
ncbi:MAG: serine hydrolase domain-containing protein [Pseudomonadota bacterium]